MHAGMREDERLRRFTMICLDLPEVKREISGSHASFTVKK
jgi:hypothetical protein